MNLFISCFFSQYWLGAPLQIQGAYCHKITFINDRSQPKSLEDQEKMIVGLDTSQPTDPMSSHDQLILQVASTLQHYIHNYVIIITN